MARENARSANACCRKQRVEIVGELMAVLPSGRRTAPALASSVERADARVKGDSLLHPGPTRRVFPAKELHRRHLPVMTQFAPLIERGQKDGVFRRDVSVSWHLAVVRALVQAASAELGSGRLSEFEVEQTIVATVLAAMSGPKE